MTRSHTEGRGSEKPVRSGAMFQAPKTAQKSAPVATAPAKPSSASPVRATDCQPTREQIAERARAIWKASGCKPGCDVENWLQAEKELRAEMRRQ